MDVPLCSVCILEEGAFICTCGTHYCGVECQRYDWAEEKHGDECGVRISSGKGAKPRRRSTGRRGRGRKKPITKAKWREMATNPPGGEFASEKQRRYFWFKANE